MAYEENEKMYFDGTVLAMFATKLVYAEEIKWEESLRASWSKCFTTSRRNKIKRYYRKCCKRKISVNGNLGNTE